MRWRGEWVLGTEAICWCIDLSVALDISTILLPRKPRWSQCLWSSMLKAYSFSTLLLCVNDCLISNSYWEKSSRIMSPLRAVVCVLLQKTTGVGTSFRQSTGLFVWKCTPLHPVFFVSKPAHRSILLTIQIVIDLPYLGPGAIRSHLLPLPYWKGKHSWCCRPKCLALGCSVGAMCLVHDGWMNSGYTFTPTHPTCSPVGGDGLSYCFWSELGSPSSSDGFCIAPQAGHLILLIYSES